MKTYDERVQAFLASSPIAVVGVSRNPKKGVGCFLTDKLLTSGRRVFVINPKAESIEGRACYPNLAALPEKPQAVLVLTHPKDSADVVKEGLALGVRQFWFHRTFDQGSYSPEAERLCLEAGLEPLVNGCPAMHVNPDPGHLCFKWILKLCGKLR